MDAKQIFAALKAGQISAADAKRRLQHLSSTPSQPESVEPLTAPLPQESQPRLPRVPTSRFAQQAPMANSAIAVVGMAGRFPGADNLAQFWQNLLDGRDCVGEIPAQRWSCDDYFDADPNRPDKSYSRWMGAMAGVDEFDPLFFNLSPAEAELMDPQQRWFLQTCWHCLEDAAIDPEQLSGSRCGVFVGCAPSDYSQQVNRLHQDASALLGGANSILSGRIAYLLNLQGPCMALDTACSSSLVALAQACDSLVLGHSDLALAGGVTILAGPSMHVMTSKAGMLSPRGRCFTFDQNADGFVPGEGVAVLLLKRLDDAERDGDPVHGLIRAWGCNQDGKTNGISAPSGVAQQRLLQEVYRRFAIDPASIGMLEAHGTGTKLGDPIEVDALNQAFAEFTSKQGFCALGSVKSNIGHLLAAAGVAGVVKALLALRHQQLPATLHFQQLNEHIDLSQSAFYINDHLQAWPSDSPRRAAVSAFGFSGTNAHLVLEQAPDAPVAARPAHLSGPDLILLSAHTQQQLQTLVQAYIDWLQGPDQRPSLADLATTLRLGRQAQRYRLALVVSDVADLLATLQRWLASGDEPKAYAGRALKGAQLKAVQPSATQLQQQITAASQALTTHTLTTQALTTQTLATQTVLQSLAQWWQQGVVIDWRQLPGRGRRVPSLPAYPFARQSLWIDGVEQLPTTQTATVTDMAAEICQPQAQGDKGAERHFVCRPVGTESFLRDHQVNGQAILPGAVYLEWLRHAAQALAPAAPAQLQLEQVTWLRPWCLGRSGDLLLSLRPLAEGFAFAVNSDGATESTLHCQGHLRWRHDLVGEQPQHDIDALRQRCQAPPMAGAELYRRFDNLQIQFGPAHRSLQTLYLGDDFLLAELALPSHGVASLADYPLHPSLLDAAFQACVAALNPASLQPALLFALRRCQIWQPCTEQMWVLVRRNGRQFDLDLCGAEGLVAVSMQGASLRASAAPSASDTAPAPISSLLKALQQRQRPTAAPSISDEAMAMVSR